MSQEGGVDDLKKKLYSRANKAPMQDVRAPLFPNAPETPPAWADSKPSLPIENTTPLRAPAPARRGFGFAGKFFIGAVVFFVAAAGLAAYYFFGGINFVSPNNIDLQIVAPSLIDGGSQAPLQFIITNRNTSELQLADLIIDYPDGTRDPKNPTQALSHDRQSIGTIASGAQLKRTADAIFYGQEGTPQTIKATLEYSLPNSNAVFTKQSDVTITIGSSPVSINVSVPQQATAGEPFDSTVTVRSNSQTPLDNVVVGAQYPFGFTVISTVPQADAGGSYWRLGTMAPGETKTIVVHGSIDGQDGDQRVFRFLAGTDSDTTDTSVKTPFVSIPATLTVARPFITGTIAINGQTGKNIAATAGAPVNAEVDWQNNLPTAVSNVEITVALSGPVLDKSSVQAGTGFYQSSTNSITWTGQEDPSLAQVAPGGTGQLTFSFATLPPGTSGALYGNPTVTLSLTVKGTRTGESGAPEQVSSVATTQVSLATAVSLAATALHFGGPFGNSGPMPPRAEQKTTYAVQWSVKNSSNIIANAVVSTVLPSYVDFVQGQSGVTYDAGSRTVKWGIGDLKPGVGYTSGAQTAAFQVALNPSTSQVNYAPQLTGVAQLSGTDRFAQVQVTATADPLTTKLTGDPQFTTGMDIVQSKQ